MYFDTASAVSFRQQHSDSGCINTELLSPLDKDLGPEAFLSHSSLALHMARFPEAERRGLHKMICMQCPPEMLASIPFHDTGLFSSGLHSRRPWPLSFMGSNPLDAVPIGQEARVSVKGDS